MKTKSLLLPFMLSFALSSFCYADKKQEQKKDHKPQLILKCKNCKNTFDGLKNKASRTAALAIGGGAGAAAGGAGGFWIGSGVGVATGGAGFPAVLVTTPVGAPFGGVVGGGAGFIWREGFYTCPKCKKTFKVK
jgi:hypothetical protein